MGGRVSRRAGAGLPAAIRDEDVAGIQAGLAGAGECGAGEPLLCLACRLGRERSVTALLACSPASQLDREDCSGFTPLILATHAGHLSIVRLLLQQPAVGTSLPHQPGPSCGRIALVGRTFSSAANPSTSTVNVTVSPPDINRVSGSGSTALEVAIIAGQTEIAGLILDNPRFRLTSRGHRKQSIISPSKRVKLGTRGAVLHHSAETVL